LKDLSFPYDHGLAFVSYLYRRGNWAEVNRAYAELPLSTEQILHPEKYVAGEAAIAVTDPPLSTALPSNWRLLADDVLGEWTTYLLLGYGAREAAQLPDETARAAAAGWGGDAYQVYYNEGAGAAVLAAHWVWDTQRDSGEFASALVAQQAARFEESAINRDGADCWELAGQVSCVLAAGGETLWLLAPDQSILNQLLALYPSFQ
jgi:hypothetical protein